jgi:hypothetical protein
MTSTYAHAIAVALLIGCSVSATDPSELKYPIISNPAPITMPESLLHRYALDAYRLAARHMQATGMTDVVIPDDLHRSILNALGYIYSAVDLPARDSIVDRYDIHTFPNPTLDEVLLFGLDTSCAWVSRLAAGTIPTDHPGVDSLLRSYGLAVREVSGIGGTRFVLLRSATPLHIAALARRFNGIECLAGAEPNGSVGDGDDIRAEADGNAWKITYSLGWGDCPAGCIHRHFWHFRVRADGFVEYLGSGGSPIPAGDPRVH